MKIMVELNSLPTSPGVYIYRNRVGEIIYVGKAINLKKRISQYFQRDDALGPKTAALVSQIDTIETKIVDSEIEALILESSLIKKHLPKYNSLLKDDRSYLYICISKDVLPRIFTAFQSNLPSNCYIYGPFPNGSAVKSLLKTIRHIFPYYNLKKHPTSPCLYCHLNMCPGPNPDPLLYRQNIGKIKKLLNGKIKILNKQLNREMKQASHDNNFEKAIIFRNQITSINYVVSGWNQLHNFLDIVKLPEDGQSNAIIELQTTLNISPINRIECFDISQLGSKYFVGAMTVWYQGHIDHSQYRKFKIKTKQTIDDQYMIKEIIYRRLQHPNWGKPDLIIVDGGKPQVSSVNSLPLTLLTDIQLIGLAKKNETIIIKTKNNWQQINLPHNSHALRLLQLLRNEAHRFANKYRKELIKKTFK